MIDDLRLELDDPSRPIVRFQLAPAIPRTPMVGRAVAAALQRAIAEATSNPKARLLHSKLTVDDDRWFSVPIKGVTVSELGALEDVKSRLIDHANQLGEGAARVAARLGR